MENILNKVKKIIPRSIFHFFQPAYHYLLALAGSIYNGHPSRKIVVIGVTGTKGKSTSVELLAKIFEEAGWIVASLSTVQFKIKDQIERNMFKMTMPGRFFVQNFIKKAVDSSCNVVVLEMSSEGARQFRHKFIEMDALVFTNLAPEHIESHGSYENYINAKLAIAKLLETSNKKNPRLVVNKDDKEAQKFLDLKIKSKITYSLGDAVAIKSDEKGSSFQIEKIVIHSKLPGTFNVYNMLGAIACAKHFGISLEDSKKALEKVDFIRGRMEKVTIQNEKEQKFDVVVDYAHTPDSLKAVYETYKDHKTICILGNTGGGRDTWKRSAMAKIAEEYCNQIILTNEDPYDEDPKKIVEEMKKVITKKPIEIIMDRRKAIHRGIKIAQTFQQTEGTSNKSTIGVLITGKGTDPYIMQANGKKILWDDAQVAREELHKIFN